MASDAVAEAFAQALRRGDALRNPDRWVWKVAFRVAAGELKERGRDRRTPTETEQTYPMPEDAMDVVRALATLSRAQRMSVVLHDFADLPVKEVARMIGSTSAAVGVHLHRARARLRPLLEVDDE